MIYCILTSYKSHDLTINAASQIFMIYVRDFIDRSGGCRKWTVDKGQCGFEGSDM